MEPREGAEQRALRVSQLDASELDSELLDVLSTQFKNIFKHFQPGFWVKVAPELRAALRYMLWRYTVKCNEASVGQQLLGLRYTSEAHHNGTSSQWMSSKQKVLFGLLTILGPWLQERAVDLAVWTREVPYISILWTLLDKSERFWKLASLLNFLVFLRQGYYQFLVERLIGIRAVYPRRTGLRQVSFEYMDREMLWHGFAEFLFFILPLINVRKIKNVVTRLLLSHVGQPSHGGRVQQDCRECAACDDWPTNPHEMGCSHVFCYVCLQGNYLADPGYVCPVCGHKGTGGIKPVLIKQLLKKEVKDE